VERPERPAQADQSCSETDIVGAVAICFTVRRVAFGSEGGVKDYSRIQDALKYVLGQAPGSKALIEWMKSGLDDQQVLQKLAGLLRMRSVDLIRRETAWLKVLAGYAFSAVDSLERDAALKWLRGDPLEIETYSNWLPRTTKADPIPRRMKSMSYASSG
jgi:hypothetical protein